MQGFEEDLPPGLRERYPEGMLPQLQSSAYAALVDMRGAFPDDTILPNTSLTSFLQVPIQPLLSQPWLSNLMVSQPCIQL